jgi:hypothetical protein
LQVTGRVEVLANEEESNAIPSDTKDNTLNKKQLVASSLVMTAALPASHYISRLLPCAGSTLVTLFHSDGETTEAKDEDASPPISSLAYAVRPCSYMILVKLPKKWVKVNFYSRMSIFCNLRRLYESFRGGIGHTEPHVQHRANPDKPSYEYKRHGVDNQMVLFFTWMTRTTMIMMGTGKICASKTTDSA